MSALEPVDIRSEVIDGVMHVALEDILTILRHRTPRYRRTAPDVALDAAADSLRDAWLADSASEVDL